MSTGAEFVERSITHQVGDVPLPSLSLSAEARDFAERVSSKMSLVWNDAEQRPSTLNGWEPPQAQQPRWQVHSSKHKNSDKIVFALKSVLEAGADFDVLIDMQDRRARNLITPQGLTFPVLSFNRPVSKKTGHILWPLPNYHDLESTEFLGQLNPERVPWHDKKDMVIWRGGPGNRGVLPRKQNSIRLLPLLRKLSAGEISKETVQAALLSMPRYRFLYNWIDDPRFDIGYTSTQDFQLEDEPLLSPLERPMVLRETFQDFKYIAVLPGNDVGSSFYWTMNSGSVGLVVDCDFETFATHHFKPWEHYVPIRRDQADVKRIMRWCASHQDECQAMAKRAQEKCKFLADPDLRTQICKGVIAKLRQELTNIEK
jgi:hypothetical protein